MYPRYNPVCRRCTESVSLQSNLSVGLQPCIMLQFLINLLTNWEITYLTGFVQSLFSFYLHFCTWQMLNLDLLVVFLNTRTNYFRRHNYFKNSLQDLSCSVCSRNMLCVAPGSSQRNTSNYVHHRKTALNF